CRRVAEQHQDPGAGPAAAELVDLRHALAITRNCADGIDASAKQWLRHSGAPRSGEPGIHSHRLGLWIPGSRPPSSASPRNDTIALADAGGYGPLQAFR